MPSTRTWLVVLASLIGLVIASDCGGRRLVWTADTEPTPTSRTASRSRRSRA